MKTLGRILVMDDEAIWREELNSVLRRSGYAVETAATSKEAAMRIQESLFHVLVLDIRMIDPDESNVEGMEFLAEMERLGLIQAVEVVMLSAYGTKEQMRQAFRRYKVADFQTKEDFRGRDFVESMRQIFSESVRWNGDLQIYWDGLEGPAQAVADIAIEGRRIKRGTPFQERIADELDDLLRRLFYKATSILVTPLIQGHSGAGVLKVQPFYAAGKGEAVVVKFGHFSMIEQEYDNYKQHVEPFIVGSRHTAVIDRRRTPTLGGIVYSLIGTSNIQIQSLRDYYRTASQSEIKEVFNQLFLGACANWYTNRGLLQPYDLTTGYQESLGFTLENLQKARQERLTSIQGSERLRFPSLQDERTFLNPITAIVNQRFVFPTYVCITHGDLNDANVLVDAAGNPWLIDFYRTGKGHILRDIAELDTVIRMQALGSDEANLTERLAMEEMLAACSRFDQVGRLLHNFPTENQALAKAFVAAVHLRSIAHEIMGRSSDDDIREFYVALMYYALNAIRFYSRPTIQREHALLCASILAERLGLGSDHG